MRFLLTFLLLAAPALAERAAELHDLPEPASLGRLLAASDDTRGALVILLPDALGEDGRAEPYAEALVERGIASLVIGLGMDRDDPNAPATDPAASAAAADAAASWAETAGFDPARIGLLGFGAGGRALLEAGGDRPVVALYPGCPGPRIAPGARALVLLGAEAPGAADCAALTDTSGVTVRALPRLGHGWDAPGALWPAGQLLPDPAGGPLLRARMDVGATLEVAETVADWFDARLGGARSAGR
jgi:dienelactone hydrolase